MQLFRRTRNFYRKARNKPIGFVYLTLSGEIPMFIEPKSYIEKKINPDPQYSFYDLWYNSQKMLGDKRVKGLIIQMSDYHTSAAMICSLRDLIKLWKTKGKIVWVYAHDLDFLDYYLASAADKIYVQKTSTIYATGTKVESIFFKSYLEEKGVKAQVSQISPYKSAFNSFIHDEIPPEQEEELNWIVETYYNIAIEAIAEGL